MVPLLLIYFIKNIPVRRYRYVLNWTKIQEPYPSSLYLDPQNTVFVGSSGTRYFTVTGICLDACEGAAGVQGMERRVDCPPGQLCGSRPRLPPHLAGTWLLSPVPRVPTQTSTILPWCSRKPTLFHQWTWIRTRHPILAFAPPIRFQVREGFQLHWTKV